MCFVEVLHALQVQGARFALIGGVAVALQGVPRMTFDLDLIVALDPDNLAKVDAALRSMNLRPRPPVALQDAASAEVRSDWLERNLLAVTYVDFDKPMREVDVLVSPPADVEGLLQRVNWRDLAGLRVPVASIADLIALKKASGRPQDLADVAWLERTQRQTCRTRPRAT